MDQSVCSSNVWRADESSTNRSDLHKQPFYFLSKIREKHQVYSHILKVDESPHFYSGTPLKYAHMIQSKLFFFFFFKEQYFGSQIIHLCAWYQIRLF